MVESYQDNTVAAAATVSPAQTAATAAEPAPGPDVAADPAAEADGTPAAPTAAEPGISDAVDLLERAITILIGL